MYQYLYPMSSIGVCAFFYYQKNDNIILLMQRRSLKMQHAPGQVSATGGYADLHIKDDGSFETFPNALSREIGEELGSDFEQAIPPDAFRMDNIAQVRQKFEEKAPVNHQNKKPFEKQMNINFVWVAKITEEIAKKAIAFDPDEVAEVLHLPIEDIQNTHDIRPWIPESVEQLLLKNYFK